LSQQSLRRAVTMRKWKLLWSCAALVAYIANQLRRRARFDLLPQAPSIKDHPILGEFLGMMQSAPIIKHTTRMDIMAFMRRATEETRKQGLVRLTVLGRWLPFADTAVFVHDINLVRKILSKDSWGVYKKGMSYDLAHDLIGSQALLASGDNDLWKEQRRVISGSFRKRMLDALVIPSVHKAVDELVGRLSTKAVPGGPLEANFAIECNRLTIDVLGKFAFGFDFGASRGELHEQSLPEDIAFVLERMSEFGKNPALFVTRWIPVPINQRYKRALDKINSEVQTAIDARLETRRSGGDFGEDLLGQLLRAEEGESVPMNRQLMIDNLRTVLFAGHDTTASALAFLFHLLATHPEEQDILAREVAGLGEETPSTEQLEALPRLDAVIKEALRLHPSAGFTRIPLEDVDLGGYTIPRGTEMFMFPYLTMRDENLFEKASSFRPQRWLSSTDDGKTPISPERAGWIPFSLGARNCVGSRLALLELKAVIYTMVSRFVLTVPDGVEPPEPVLYMTLVPNHVPMQMWPRPRT